MIWDLFRLCPTPAAAIAADVGALAALIQPLGLFRKRAAGVQRLSEDYLYKQVRLGLPLCQQVHLRTRGLPAQAGRWHTRTRPRVPAGTPALASIDAHGLPMQAADWLAGCLSVCPRGHVLAGMRRRVCAAGGQGAVVA